MSLWTADLEIPVLPTYLNGTISFIRTMKWNETSKKGPYYWNEAVKPENNLAPIFSYDAKKAEEMRKLGFGNQWYSFGFKHIVKANIDGFHHVNIFPAPFFIAAKMEAFKGRGKNDGRTSTDFEDIVFVLNNRSRVWDELELAEKNVKGYLQDEFRRVLDDPYFFEWISCHIGYHEQRRTSFIIGGLTHFVNH